jgi:hypothetical protein
MNKFYEGQYGPSGINSYAQQMNPWVWGAVNGQQGTTGFQKSLYDLAQGNDISPYLLNQPLNQINQGANRNMQSLTAQLGRSNMSGGLANAYALSNQMGRQNATANLYQNYGQWREQQRRSDLNWLLGQIQQSQQQGANIGSNIAQSHTFKKNFFQKLGAFGQAYAAGSGGGGGMPSNGLGKAPNTDQQQRTQDAYGSQWGAGTGEDTMGGSGNGAAWGNTSSNYGGGGGGWNSSTGNFDNRVQMGTGRTYY